MELAPRVFVAPPGGGGDGDDAPGGSGAVEVVKAPRGRWGWSAAGGVVPETLLVPRALSPARSAPPPAAAVASPAEEEEEAADAFSDWHGAPREERGRNPFVSQKR
jgi:hypothetical protein